MSAGSKANARATTLTWKAPLESSRTPGEANSGTFRTALGSNLPPPCTMCPPCVIRE